MLVFIHISFNYTLFVKAAEANEVTGKELSSKTADQVAARRCDF
jgi:hypothetical protein